MMTVEKFNALDPWTRGYLDYMAVARDDEPNVPNESNPFPPGTAEADLWDQGQQLAVIHVQDNP